MRVAIVDDDEFTRLGMVAALAAEGSVEVLLALGHEEAEGLSDSRWLNLDLAIVEIFDASAPGEVGTDMFAGIPMVQRLTALRVPVLALTQRIASPLIRLRIWEANPTWVYARHEVHDAVKLLDAIHNPDPDHRPIRPSEWELFELGAQRANGNAGVRMYEQSSLYPRLAPTLKLRRAGSRRQVDRFRRDVASTGFIGVETTISPSRRLPRWPETRSYILTLLGRGKPRGS